MENAAKATEPAVYSSHDICRLFDIEKNRIPAMIESGTIPEPLPTCPKGRRLWAKAKIDQVLGIGRADDELVLIIRSAVKEALKEIIAENKWDRLVHSLLNTD